jgi:hypothetical protein
MREKAGEPKLFASSPLNKYGNTSLLYDRKDLLVTTMTMTEAPTRRTWVVRGSDRPADKDIPKTWTKTMTIVEGETSIDAFTY